MIEFVSFLLQKVYKSVPIPKKCIDAAFNHTILDIKYHFPNISEIDVKNRIETNANELAVFLFRLGNELHKQGLEDLKWQIHWLLKELCSCEIYFNNQIGQGFYIVHGLGTVIGSRNIIGQGFKIHHGCTIGHKKNRVGNGNYIGNDVTMYCNSSILGELKIGHEVVIGSHVLITNNIENKTIVTSTLVTKVKSITT